MTKRAKRLNDFLSKQSGWETGYDTGITKCKCGETRHFSSAKHCHACGEVLPPAKKDTSVLVDLEKAIAYALGESE